MSANSVRAVCIHIAFMAAIATFIVIYINKEYTGQTVLKFDTPRTSAVTVVSIIRWSKVNLPEHELPLPLNPSLHVQLCPPTVLLQFAFTSHLWLPLLHSSISTITRDTQDKQFKPQFWKWYFFSVLKLPVAVHSFLVETWVSQMCVYDMWHCYVID